MHGAIRRERHWANPFRDGGCPRAPDKGYRAALSDACTAGERGAKTGFSSTVVAATMTRGTLIRAFAWLVEKTGPLSDDNTSANSVGNVQLRRSGFYGSTRVPQSSRVR